MDWTQALTNITSLGVPMLVGYAWIIHRMEERFSEMNERLSALEGRVAHIEGMLAPYEPRVHKEKK